MARLKAVLIPDPARRDEQLAYLRERVEILLEAGDLIWASITDDQVPRFAEQGITTQVRVDADLVQVPGGAFDPVAALPEPPAALQGEGGYLLVQFVAPPDRTWIAAIAALGGDHVRYLPAAVGVFHPAPAASAVAGLPFVRWAGAWQPAYALGGSLVTPPGWLSGLPTPTPVIAPGAPVDEAAGNVLVSLFDDVATADVHDAVVAAGAAVVADLGNGFVVRADAAAVSALAAVAGVFAVEAFAQPVVGNDRAGVIVGVNQVRHVGAVDFLVNLDGAGEIVGVIDSGLDTGALPAIHADLKGRVLQIANLATPGTPVPDRPTHGTHVTGTIAGDGTGSGGRLRGVAPAAWVVFQGPVPASAVAGLTAAHDAGARVHNNSWGSPDRVTDNAYDGTSESLDYFCYTHPDSLVVFITQNWERDTLPAPGGDGILDAVRVTPEAAAKNVLAVGATESVRSDDGFAGSYRTLIAPPPGSAGGLYDNAGLDAVAGSAPGAFGTSDDADQVALFSNRGRITLTKDKNGHPIGHGWVRPDLVAPGTNILSLRSSLDPPPTPRTWHDPTTADANRYMLLDGTSMAGPQVSGAALLARQYYRARFGQLRRPTLLEAVPVPAGGAGSPPFTARPAVTTRPGGLVFAWVPPGAVTLRAARLTRELTFVGAAVTLQADVGDHPAPALAAHADHVLLVYRAKDATVRLASYRGDLSQEPGFGTAGTVTLGPVSRPDDDRPPALAVAGEEVAVAWADGTADQLLFQRFAAGTGAVVDQAAVVVGPMTQTSAHPYLIRGDTHYALAWVHRDGQVQRLHVRLLDGGTPVGAAPLVVLEQSADVRDPHLVWQQRGGRYAVVWCDGRDHAGGDIRIAFLAADGTPQGADAVCLPVPATATVRRPFIAVHPDTGYVLMWEDDTQGGHFDVYLTFLDDSGQPDGRIPPDPRDPLARRLVRVSDTPEDTAGFAGLADTAGVALAWQSTDEINSDRRGAFAVGLTPRGAFRAQVDPATPLVESGRYVNHVLAEERASSLHSVAIAHTGGSYFLMRGGVGYFSTELQVLSTDGDSRPVPDGARTLRFASSYGQVALHWTGSKVACASVALLDSVQVWLLDGTGKPVPGFGAGGQVTIDPGGYLVESVTPGLGHFGTVAGGLRIVVAFGVGFPQPDRIRYAVLDGTGAFATAPKDLVAGAGTARHGWFHFVEKENHAIAAWHRSAGAGTAVYVNRFAPDGIPQHAADLPVTAMAGESVNATVATRTAFLGAMQYEYAVVWQYRASGGAPWELRFSRLDRDGKTLAAPPSPLKQRVPAVPTSDVLVISAGVGGWAADTDALEPQLVCSLVHDPWANPPVPLPAGTSLPKWSPGYGLAWLGRPAGGAGTATLYFTALDENGVRALVPQPPPHPPAAAPITQVSRAGVDVREFALVWNGRTFRLTWTEVEGDITRHMQTALTRHGSHAVYDEPSAALLRATLVGGATNILRTDLPNLDQPAPGLTSGYGWGRLNVRQSLAPSPPVTFAVRDDLAIGRGRTASYHVTIPPGTALLRATLTWTDPPGRGVVNRLHLQVIPPSGEDVYQGNTWQPPPNGRLSRPVSTCTAFAKSEHTVEQVVLENPPPGRYEVVIFSEDILNAPLTQLELQPFALVVVGSGPEVRFGGFPAARIPVY